MRKIPQCSRAPQDRNALAEHLEPGQFEEFEALLSQTERLLGNDSVPPLDEINDFKAASQALAISWQGIRDAKESGQIVTSPADGITVADLIDRVVRNERVIRAADDRAHEAAIRQVRETLAELRDIDTVDGLVRAGAEAICHLGFDRSIVSWVEGNTWMTEWTHLKGDSQWAAQILDAGRSHPEPLVPGLPEHEARRRRKPVLVTQVQEREAVHKAVAEASGSRSYVAAPIMPNNQLLGFVHGDKIFHRGDVTEFDADLIGAFAQGYAFAIERALLIEELNQMRSMVRQVGSQLQACSSSDGTIGVALANPGAVVQFETPAGPELTRRESDVFKLVAQGETNQRIASRLSISEGTVKSHVKHILRKLGAANRAEAVSRWHAMRDRE